MTERRGSGAGAAWLTWGSLALVLAALFSFGYTRDQFYNADAYDYAQMGRELAEGRGFTGLQAFPRHLVFFHERGMGPDEPWPDLYRYPLSVAGNALFQLLVADSITAAILRSGFFFCVGLALLGWLVERVTHSRLIGLGVFALLASDRELWVDAYSGMVDSQASFLLTLHAVGLLFLPRTAKGGFVVGVGAAVLYLGKTQFAGAVPVSLLLLFLDSDREERWRVAVSFLAGCIVTMAPWMAHNLIHAGEPNFSFTTTRSLGFGTSRVGSDFEMRIDAPMTVGGVLREHGSALWTKFRFGLVEHLKEPIYESTFYSVLAYVALLALLPRSRFPGDRTAQLFARFVLGMLIMHVCAESVSYPTPRFSYPFRGLQLILAAVLVAGGLAALPALGRSRVPPVMLGLCLAVAAPGALALVREGIGPPAAAAPEVPAEELRELCSEGSVIASDASHVIALDARRRSVRLPTYGEELLTLDAEVRSIDFVFASARIPTSSRRTDPRPTLFPSYAHYGSFLSSPAFLARYALVQRFPDGARLYAKRVRAGEGAR